jgi:hypothetical protein
MSIVLSLSPALSLALGTIFHILVSRLTKLPFWSGMFFSILFGSAASFLGVVVFEYALALPPIGFIFYFVVTSLCLGFCYFHFVNLGETSIRIRILKEFAAAQKGLGLEQIRQNYGEAALVQSRITRLIDAGALTINGEDIAVSSIKLKMIYSIMNKLRKLVFGRGYDVP